MPSYGQGDTIKKVIFSISPEHLHKLDKVSQGAKFGTSRSAVLRAILNEYFAREGME